MRDLPNFYCTLHAFVKNSVNAVVNQLNVFHLVAVAELAVAHLEGVELNHFLKTPNFDGAIQGGSHDVGVVVLHGVQTGDGLAVILEFVHKLLVFWAAIVPFVNP